MMRETIFAVVALGAALLTGCSQPQPANMAPPVGNNNMAQGGGSPMNAAPPMNMNSAPPAQSAGVYQWQEVPQNQQVPISRATFDQGGYQIFAQSGETIVVPFANQNLYVMKFGRTNGQPYFENHGDAPILYLPQGGYLENAAAQNARWYPIPNDYAYSQPMYVSLAPSWNDYTAMGWYPGMTYYGGMGGYSPYHTLWMPGYYVSIGGHRYNDYAGYRSYYSSTPGYVRTTTVYNNYGTPRGSSGSFGTGARSSAFSTGGSRSFGNAATSQGSFRPSGSGSFPSARPFGGDAATRTGGSFGSIGSVQRNSSFGGSNPGFRSTPHSSSGSFGAGGGGSFGGGTRSFGGGGGGSFGGGTRSFGGGGGSFGGGGTRSFGGGGRRR